MKRDCLFLVFLLILSSCNGSEGTPPATPTTDSIIDRFPLLQYSGANQGSDTGKRYICTNQIGTLNMTFHIFQNGTGNFSDNQHDGGFGAVQLQSSGLAFYNPDGSINAIMTTFQNTPWNSTNAAHPLEIIYIQHFYPGATYFGLPPQTWALGCDFS